MGTQQKTNTQHQGFQAVIWEAHKKEILNHHSKYGMLNSKDPTKVETYYNKRHGSEKANKILGLINEELLDGVAFKTAN